MDYRLVLTAALGQLHDDAVEKIAALVGHPPHWLSAGTACEFRVDGPEVKDRARAALKDSAVDVNALPAEGRRKKLLLADMDSTIIGCECLDELADFAGLKPKIAAITERAMRGEIDFAQALTQRVAMLKGLSVSALEACYRERVTLNPGAKTMIATMKAHGPRCVLV